MCTGSGSVETSFQKKVRVRVRWKQVSRERGENKQHQFFPHWWTDSVARGFGRSGVAIGGYGKGVKINHGRRGSRRLADTEVVGKGPLERKPRTCFKMVKPYFHCCFRYRFHAVFLSAAMREAGFVAASVTPKGGSVCSVVKINHGRRGIRRLADTEVVGKGPLERKPRTCFKMVKPCFHCRL